LEPDTQRTQVSWLEVDVRLAQVTHLSVASSVLVAAMQLKHLLGSCQQQGRSTANE
jgi:hypothetical protein